MASPGLINLQTDLTSLRYGSDKPYVTKDIGQAPSTQVGRQIQSRIDDTSRIAQMLIDKPGLKFLGNQALLQQVDIQDKLQKSRDKGKSLAGAIVKQGLQTVKQTAKILGSTLAQVPVNGTGTHFVYAFRTDTYLQPSGGNSRTAFAQFFGAGGVEGAPLALKGKPIEGVVESNFGTKISDSEFKLDIDTPLDYGEPNQKKVQRGAKNQAQAGNPIYAGPVQTVNIPFGGRSIPITIPAEARDTTATSGSLGISNRDVKGDVTSLEPVTIAPFKENETTRKSISDTLQNIRNAQSGSVISLKKEEHGRETTATPKEIGISSLGLSGSVDSKNGEYNKTVQDFRKVQGKAYSFDYNSNKINREQRVNLGNQGKVSFNRDNYGNSSDTDTHDTLNKLNESATRIDGTADARDLAKLYFEIITPDGSTFLHFRAFIDSIDDSYNADWQGFKYVGRAENFYTYGGFDRDINISFKIAAATRAEMKPLYRKMVYLASSTAPTYGEQGFMRGTLARMTIGSYIAQIPGVITSVKYSLIQDMPWEISMQNPEAGTDDDMQELPMGLQCSVSFKAIHDFAPQTGLQHYFTSPEPLNGSKSFLI